MSTGKPFYFRMRQVAQVGPLQKKKIGRYFSHPQDMQPMEVGWCYNTPKRKNEKNEKVEERRPNEARAGIVHCCPDALESPDGGRHCGITKTGQNKKKKKLKKKAEKIQETSSFLDGFFLQVQIFPTLPSLSLWRVRAKVSVTTIQIHTTVVPFPTLLYIVLFYNIEAWRKLFALHSPNQSSEETLPL